MDIADVLAENERLIAEAEEALFSAAELAERISSGVLQSSREGGKDAVSKLLDDLIEIRGRLLTQQANLLAVPTLPA